MSGPHADVGIWAGDAKRDPGGRANDVLLGGENCRPAEGHPEPSQPRNPAAPAGTTLATRWSVRPTPRLILLVFLLMQICDGLLTYTAVAVLGVSGEGNIMLAALMQVVGAGPTLVGAKSVAVCCGVLLYVRGCYGILGALTGFYACAAITPWLVIFHNL